MSKFIFENKEGCSFDDLDGDKMRIVMDAIQELDGSGILQELVEDMSVPDESLFAWVSSDGDGDIVSRAFRVLARPYRSDDAFAEVKEKMLDMSERNLSIFMVPKADVEMIINKLVAYAGGDK